MFNILFGIFVLKCVCEYIDKLFIVNFPHLVSNVSRASYVSGASYVSDASYANYTSYSSYANDSYITDSVFYPVVS